MKALWVCGNYYGPPEWRRCWGDWCYEPDDCGGEIETEVDPEEWEAEECGAVCPKCGAELTQKYDCPELVKEEV